ncbi:sterile alpha motif domain containing protein 4 smaug isoform X2 [Haematobia irritans]|uniref:sterile alpha motif domain containing protein 4 smaug isoform X2 n=1 Tax=Haematobia irritans TaxID=7368 RepID=UPI003F4FEBCE
MKYTTNTENQNVSNVSQHSHSHNSISNNNAIVVTSLTSTTNTTTNGGSTTATGNALFCEQVNTVTNFFEKWNDCERTVVMYALLKRLRYPSLKFLQYSIDNTLTQNMGSSSNLSTVVIDVNANNPSYLQNLLNAYKTFHLGDLVDTLSSSSSDKDSMPSCYGSDFQLTHCDERKLYGKKEDILHEVLNMLPLLKPGNDEAKMIYLSLIPLAVKDTIRQIVPTELVQQIFSYMLIHSAVSSEDRRSLNGWLRHLEEHLQSSNNCASFNMGLAPPHIQNSNFISNQSSLMGSLLLENPTMTTSGSSATSSSSSALSISSTASNASVASSFGNLTQNCNSTTIASQSIMGSRNTDWQTIQPPSRQQQLQQQQQQQTKQTSSITSDWSSLVKSNNNNNNNNTGPINNSAGNSVANVGVVVNVGNSGVVGNITDQLCDNLNGITLNELASSQNSLGLNLGTSIVDSLGGGVVDTNNCASLVNGLAAAAASATAASSSSVATTPSLFGPQTNPIINIINNNNNCSSQLNGIEDHDTSFSKNGTEILDFDPNVNTMNNCDSCSNSSSNLGQLPPQMGYASILMSNCGDQLDINRWSLDSKFAALKTRRSNSLTTQTISSSASSSNSSVITVNDNCSNSTENLAQFANKPRSFSLSIEHHRGSLTNSGSDTRLDDFKPNYIKFQTRNVGMSSIGLWLKSLRLHKYIELFKNMTYEDMLQISEEYLQSLGVTKGASHKLALCIEKLKERSNHLAKMEHELLNGQLKLQAAVEELANIVLTPMKPIELVAAGDDNVALMFLKIVDLVCTIAQKDPYAVVDDDNISVILWILDRSIHNEAFVNHVNQLKELKFKLSKLKMSLTPKMHHAKNGSNGNLNKPRWNGKTRKCDQKNGSNDRINHRKNSNDMLNFSLSCLQQQHHHNQQISDYDKFNHSTNNNYKNYQHQNFPALPQQQQQHNPQHRRSLNNLIVVSGVQQPQKMIFQPGQAILSATNNNGGNDEISSIDIPQQSRKASLTSMNNNNNLEQSIAGGQHNSSSSSAANVTISSVPKKTMAAVVMENLAKFDQHFTLF